MDGNMMMMMGIPKGDNTCRHDKPLPSGMNNIYIELPENYTSDAVNSSLHLYEILIKFF